jgi:hypothetical protein
LRILEGECQIFCVNLGIQFDARFLELSLHKWYTKLGQVISASVEYVDLSIKLDEKITIKKDIK